MEYIVDGKKVRYNPFHMKKSSFLGSGLEGKCYKVGSYAVKFYSRFPRKMTLTKEEALQMSNIETKRILLPLKVLLNKRHQMQGYYTLYVENLGKKSFYQLEREQFLEELKLLKEDLSLLGENHILLEDLMEESNTVFHNGIYLVDPGSYSFDPLAFLKNEALFNEYLEQVILGMKIKRTCNRAATKRILSGIRQERMLQSYSSMLTFLEEKMQEENFNVYIKKKIKEYSD